MKEFEAQKQVVVDILDTYSENPTVVARVPRVPAEGICEFLSTKQSIAIMFVHTTTYEKMKTGDYSERFSTFSVRKDEVKVCTSLSRDLTCRMCRSINNCGCSLLLDI